MGFAKTPQPHVIADSKATVVSFIGEREIASVLRAADPFGVDGACELNPSREHYGVASCGEVVCGYCSRIFWR